MTVRLEYQAGPGCPDGADFKAAVVARLGYDPFLETAPRHVLVEIAPRAGAIDGRIEWRDSSGRWAGEQTFPSVSTDCPRLVRAMGFALAVQIQLLARAAATPDVPVEAPPEPRSPPEAPATAPKPPTATIPAPPPPVPVAIAVSPSPAAARPVFAIGAGPAVGFGLSSEPVALGRVFGALAWPRLSVEAAVLASHPATTRRADGAGFSQQHLLGSAATCWMTSPWSACALINVGAVRMVGTHIDRPTSATVPVVETGIRAGVRQRLGRPAFLDAHADGLINVTRWTGSLDQISVWTAPRFAAALGVDVGVQFR